MDEQIMKEAFDAAYEYDKKIINSINSIFVVISDLNERIYHLEEFAQMSSGVVNQLIDEVNELMDKVQELEMRVIDLEGIEEEVLVDEEYVDYVEKTEAIEAISALLG